MLNRIEKGNIFRALHERDEAFIIPNPYDAGTARLLEHLGFEALATTGAGFAFSVGLSIEHRIRRSAFQSMRPKKRRRAALLFVRPLRARRKFRLLLFCFPRQSLVKNCCPPSNSVSLTGARPFPSKSFRVLAAARRA